MQMIPYFVGNSLVPSTILNKNNFHFNKPKFSIYPPRNFNQLKFSLCSPKICQCIKFLLPEIYELIFFTHHKSKSRLVRNHPKQKKKNKKAQSIINSIKFT